MDQIERVHRPLAFDKMEGLVREMQDPETGVPVRSQKLFLTSIPSAFMGYDLIEWLLERLNIEESVEAVHLANQLCNYGYFFPVSDSKNLVVKDDSSFYRFQTPYYWPWQNKNPDKVEYAIYLAKRTLRNKQRHGLEEYEMEALASLKKNLQNKWDFITMQAEEQLRLAKERKKGDKIVSDSQERAYWRVYRPPPGYSSCLESIPIPHRNRGTCQKKKTVEDLQKEVEFLQKSLSRTRIKVSAAIENLTQYSDTFMEYDAFFTSPQPSNPWLSDDVTFWQLNGPLVEVPTEKRVKRWALSIEDLVSDPTGLQEFTNYLRKQFSHENIRFWMAVNDLRRSSQQQIAGKVQKIFDEFLAPGAPCEINIDSKTMEKVHKEMKTPTRFTFDSAAEHVYTLLLKKDCYPRFIRSEHYKNLLAAGVQPSHKKRFFGFGGPVKKKSSASSSAPIGNVIHQQQLQQSQPQQSFNSGLGRRRGSDRNLSGSAHELAISSVSGSSKARVTHSHSQSNLSDIPYRDPAGGSSDEGESIKKDDICPWDSRGAEDLSAEYKRKKLGIAASCAGSITSEEIWDNEGNISLQALDPRISRKNSSQMDSGSSSSELSLAILEVSERLRRTCGITQQSSFPEREEGRLRKLSTTSADNVSSRRSSIAINSHTVSIGSSLKPLPRKEKELKSSTSSSVEGSSVICPSTEAKSLLQQQLATVTPQRLFQDEIPPDKTKDDKLDVDTSQSAKKKMGGIFKKSSKSTTPLISVSSVVEDVSVDEGSPLNRSTNLENDEIVKEDENGDKEPEEQKQRNEKLKEDDVEDEEGLQSSDRSDKGETSNEGAFQESSDDKSKDSTLSNWEEEENVVTPLVKTYATLGYL